MGQGLRAEQAVWCVDLDGTLVHTDLLHEALCVMLRRNPLALLGVAPSLLKGKAAFKRAVAKRVVIDAAQLPYNDELLSLLKQERAGGTRILLTTASDQIFADSVADHLGIFDHVIASDGSSNIRGESKLKAINQVLGGKPFGYAGNSWIDRAIWRESSRAILSGAPARLERAMAKESQPVHIISRAKSAWKSLPRLLRVHQWVKNLLLLCPAIMAHRIFDIPVLQQLGLAMLSFSLCASAVYVLNDLFDLEADRAHHTKKRRPFAAGTVPLSWGILLVPLLLVSSATISFALPQEFRFLLGVYFTVTCLYSFMLKRMVVLDILTLAMLYTVRVLAGGHAVVVPVSPWLLAFSMFFFLSLACVKRFSELNNVVRSNGTEVQGRGYVASDLEQVAQFGSTSGYLAVLVLALYINSQDVTKFYSQPAILWLLCPLILYWVSRVWVLARRGEVQEDPIVFAIHDIASYVTGLLAALLILFAI